MYENKNNVKWPISKYFWELEPQQLIFIFLFWSAHILLAISKNLLAFCHKYCYRLATLLIIYSVLV